MHNISVGFQSPALAQATLFNSNNLKNVAKENMSNISTIPSFADSCQNGASRSDFGIATHQLIKLLERKARSAFEKMMISERGQGILAKALKYNISFDEHNIDFLSLIDEIDEYEALIARSDELNIDWDYDYYDPIA